MFVRNRKCYCMYNNYQNDSNEIENDMIETTCMNMTMF